MAYSGTSLFKGSMLLIIVRVNILRSRMDNWGSLLLCLVSHQGDADNWDRSVVQVAAGKIWQDTACRTSSQHDWIGLWIANCGCDWPDSSYYCINHINICYGTVLSRLERIPPVAKGNPMRTCGFGKLNDTSTSTIKQAHHRILLLGSTRQVQY